MGTVKAIVGILVVIGVIYVCFQIIPPMLNNYSFQDDLRSVAMIAGGNPHESDQEILDSVLKRGRDHDITLTPEQVVVQRIGTPGAPAVYVGVDYTVPVSLPGYNFTMHFTPNSGNR